MSSLEEIWEIVKDRIGISREEFFEEVSRLSERADINERAAALLVARRRGINPMDILYPPILGRILEAGPVRETRGGIEYRIFTLVNERELRLCVAFGREHVKRVGELEDRVVSVSRYVVARTRMGELTRITENSVITELSDDLLPPIHLLPPARVPTLKQLKEVKAMRVASAMVIIDEITQVSVCPLCGRSVDLVGDEWMCETHGPVEPDTKNIHRVQLADRTGIYMGVYLGPTRDIEGKRVTFKGMFRGEELFVSKIYDIEEVG